MPEERTTDDQAGEKELAANIAQTKAAQDEQAAAAQVQAAQDQAAQVQAAQAAQFQAVQTAAYQEEMMQANMAQMQAEEDEEGAQALQNKAPSKKPRSWEAKYAVLLIVGFFVDSLGVLNYFLVGYLITIPINLMFSIYRWMTLEKLNEGSENSSQKWLRRMRTVVGGVTGAGIGLSFANTSTMFWELMVKKGIANKAIGIAGKTTPAGRAAIIANRLINK